MTKTKLRLDFSLETAQERRDFIENYCKAISFTPTTKDIETIGDYILYGKESDGKSAVQKGEIDIVAIHSPWKRKQAESLDQLLESQTFDENVLAPIGNPYQTKKPRERFNRETTLAEAPEDLKPQFIELWRKIDEADLITAYYNLAHQRRTAPPRDELLDRFTAEEQTKLREIAEQLTQYEYIKYHRNLVRYRTQQYELRETYNPTKFTHFIPRAIQPLKNEDYPQFGAEIAILPCGGYEPELFIEFEYLNPFDLTKEMRIQHKRLMRSLENVQDELYIDFRDQNHIYQLIQNYANLADSINPDDIFNSTKLLFSTFEYYISMTPLNSVDLDVLRMRMAGCYSNRQIAEYINQKYDRNHSENYIATILKKQLCKKIAETAEKHAASIYNITDFTRYKKCLECGTYYARHPLFYSRRKESYDGHEARCKACEKEMKKKYKKKNE